MIKPKALKRGDKIAIVSLSSGLAGEDAFRHKYELGKQRLQSNFGLEPVVMPNALKGIEYLDKHPEARASDLMDAFCNSSINGIFCMIGGDDTIRLLPHIDYTVIKNNPKVFMGYSDSTINHFMMYKAGLVSFYGPSIMAEFAENVAMHEYTKNIISSVLFNPHKELNILHSGHWTSEFLDWSNSENSSIARKMTKDTKGYEVIQGKGTVNGKLLGGCLDVFPMILGTELWPEKDRWDDTLLFLETSEECPNPNVLKYFLRGLVAQGLFDKICGVIFGKPMGEKFYEDYKKILTSIIGDEAGKKDMPILYNASFGHNAPMCVLPYGTEASIDCDKKTFKICNTAVLVD